MTQERRGPPRSGTSMPPSSNIAGRYEEDSTGALLRQSELTAGIASQFLSKCTIAEKKHFIDSQRSICKFELGVNRAAMAEVQDVISSKGITNSRAFLSRNEEDICYECSVRSKDDLLSMERYLLAKVAWVNGVAQLLQVGEGDQSVEHPIRPASPTTAAVPVPIHVMEAFPPAKGDRFDQHGTQSAHVDHSHDLKPSSVVQCIFQGVRSAKELACASAAVSQSAHQGYYQPVEDGLSNVARLDCSYLAEDASIQSNIYSRPVCTPKGVARSPEHEYKWEVVSQAPNGSLSVYTSQREPTSAQIEYAKMPLFSPFPIQQYECDEPRRIDPSFSQIQQARSNLSNPVPIDQVNSSTHSRPGVDREISSPTRMAWSTVLDRRTSTPTANSLRYLRSHTMGSTCELRRACAFHRPASVKSPNSTLGKGINGNDEGRLIDAASEQTGTSRLNSRNCLYLSETSYIAAKKGLPPSRNNELVGCRTPDPVEQARGCVPQRVEASVGYSTEGVVGDYLQGSIAPRAGTLVDLSEPETGTSDVLRGDNRLITDNLIDFGKDTDPTTPQKTTATHTGGSAYTNELTPISKFACRASSDRRAIGLEILAKQQSPVAHPFAQPSDISSSRDIPPRLKQNCVTYRDSSDRISSTSQYGVQYVPYHTTTSIDNPQAQIDSLCQAVIVSNLPADAELRDVMPRVRGGRILQSTLVDTTVFKLGRSVLMVFDKCSEAQAYVGYANQHPGHITVLGQQVSVDFAGTPTYPRRGIKQLRDGESRCLEFRWAPAHFCDLLLNHIELSFRHIEDALEDMWYDSADSILMLFKNADYAIRFDRFIRGRNEYVHKCHNLEYTRDPCSAPVSYLSCPASLARGRFDSLLEGRLSEKKHGRTFALRDDAQIIPPSAPAEVDLGPTLSSRILNIPVTAAQCNDEVAAVEPNDATVRFDGIEPATEFPAGYEEPHSIDVLKLGDRKTTLLRGVMTMADFRKKYDFDGYQESPEKWRTTWPYVGDFKITKQPEVLRWGSSSQAMVECEDDSDARMATVE